MKVYAGSYLIFFLQKIWTKEMILNEKIWITGIFVFSCFVAIKTAVSVEISCCSTGKCQGSG